MTDSVEVGRLLAGPVSDWGRHEMRTDSLIHHWGFAVEHAGLHKEVVDARLDLVRALLRDTHQDAPPKALMRLDSLPLPLTASQFERRDRLRARAADIDAAFLPPAHYLVSDEELCCGRGRVIRLRVKVKFTPRQCVALLSSYRTAAYPDGQVSVQRYSRDRGEYLPWCVQNLAQGDAVFYDHGW